MLQYLHNCFMYWFFVQARVSQLEKQLEEALRIITGKDSQIQELEYRLSLLQFNSHEQEVDIKKQLELIKCLTVKCNRIEFEHKAMDRANKELSAAFINSELLENALLRLDNLVETPLYQTSELRQGYPFPSGIVEGLNLKELFMYHCTNQLNCTRIDMFVFKLLHDSCNHLIALTSEIRHKLANAQVKVFQECNTV